MGSEETRMCRRPNSRSQLEIYTKMKISVAMCTFNGSRYLDEQLASICSQVRLPDEVVICDDGSSDNTPDLLHAFAACAPFKVHVRINESNLGTIKNFEQAIRLCSGDIIALSDQDDVWLPQKLTRMEQIFLQTPQTGGVFTDAEIVDSNLRCLDFSLWHVYRFQQNLQRVVQQGNALDILLKQFVVTGATFAFRSCWKDRLIPIPSCWMHDAWIALNIAIFSNLSIINEKLIKYRQHGNNQIGAMPKGIKYRMRESLNTDRDIYYPSELGRYQIAYDHFSKWFPPEHETIKKLSAKIHHLKIRSSLPSQRLFRIPTILKELITWKYHRYSTSWQVALKDLLIP